MCYNYKPISAYCLPKMINLNLQYLQYACIDIVQAIGPKLKQIYHDQELYNSVQYKKDNSPVTKADICANEFICRLLQSLTPHFPIISEENSLPSYEIRKQWEYYWLIDPLDGTKEFLRKTDEFSINIALIKNNKPILGIIYSPISDKAIFSYQNQAFKIEKYRYSTTKIKNIFSSKIPQIWRIVCSRSSFHQPLLQNYLKVLKAKQQQYTIMLHGSSLKFCLLAENKADIYIRFGPTSEWDTAAGQCILTATGGNIYNFQGQEISYNNKDKIINPMFFAIANDKISWKKLLHLDSYQDKK